ncbi:MAG: M56 family metallopeptidase [Acidipila sp.]|nr:M56 family metallopeptidase [Acidipila sp.]
MIFSYFLRLICLCFSLFFCVHTALGLVAWMVTPAAIRMAEEMRPKFAVRFLLALRLLPVSLALFAVVGLCVPSYLWLEPDASPERVGYACLVSALMGLALWCISLSRVGITLANSIRYTRHCQRTGREICVVGGSSPLLVIEDEGPVLAVTGVLHSQLVVSSAVLRALTTDQLDAALLHENAHRISRDNLKRLSFLLAPELFPFLRCFARLEQDWARLTEWATDDEAARGNPHRAVSLASALIRVARMGPGPKLSLFLVSLVADGRDLSARVERLLCPAPPQERMGRQARVLLGSACLLAGVATGMLMVRPQTFSSMHRLLEQFLR